MLKLSILSVGVATAGLSAYGAFEQAAKSDGGYLMIAAPVVALAAALVPYFAECAWKAKQRFHAIVWVLCLIPCGATVFFAATERVHLAKAGLESERAAFRSAVVRAETSLQETKVEAQKAEADAKTWRTKSKKACDPITCLKKWDDAAGAARARVQDAQNDVTKARAKAAEEPPLVAPVWLLPVALDFVSFAAIWLGLSIRTKGQKTKDRKRSKPRRPAPPKPRKGPAAVQALVPVNVVTMKRRKSQQHIG